MHNISTIPISLRTYYSNLKIKYKFFLVHLVIVITVCLTSLIAIQAALSIYQKIIYNEVAKELNFSAISIENELDQIERYSFGIITSSEIQLNLEKLKSNLKNHMRTQYGQKLSDNLWSITFERNIISVNIIDVQGRQYSGGAPIGESIVRQIIAKAAKREGAVVFLEPINDNYIICTRQIRKIHGLTLDPLGTLVIRINTPSLVQQCTAGSIGNPVDLVIMSKKKTIYASNLTLEKLSEKFNQIDETGYLISRMNNKIYFVSHIKSNYTQWTYLSILPYESILKQVSIVKSIVLLIFLLLLVLVLLICTKLANNMTRPIENLSIKMKRVQNGDFIINGNDIIDSPRTDEIGDLEKDFNIMIDKINYLINENYIKQILVKDAQLKALRANINPHFLYNTLESINWLAKTNNQSEISLMIESLGRLLRNAISEKDHLATIQEEIQLLQDYLTIQKLRFGKRLEFKIAIAPKWYKIHIPRLSLQPIVENSITYGLEKTLEICRITVSSRVNHDFLLIVVKDNGPGIPAQILDKLRRWEHEPNGLGIGLKNIDDRFKLIYGDQYGLKIESELRKGTKVILRIPLTRDKYV